MHVVRSVYMSCRYIQTVVQYVLFYRLQSVLLCVYTVDAPRALEYYIFLTFLHQYIILLYTTTILRPCACALRTQRAQVHHRSTL